MLADVIKSNTIDLSGREGVVMWAKRAWLFFRYTRWILWLGFSWIFGRICYPSSTAFGLVRASYSNDRGLDVLPFP
jgi:hypothetical protein